MHRLAAACLRLRIWCLLARLSSKRSAEIVHEKGLTATIVTSAKVNTRRLKVEGDLECQHLIVLGDFHVGVSQN